MKDMSNLGQMLTLSQEVSEGIQQLNHELLLQQFFGRDDNCFVKAVLQGSQLIELLLTTEKPISFTELLNATVEAINDAISQRTMWISEKVEKISSTLPNGMQLPF